MHPPYKGVTLFLLTRIFLILKSDPILVILLEMQLNPAVKMRPHPVVHPISAVLNERSYLQGTTTARKAEAMPGVRLEYPIKTLAFFTPVSHSFAKSERAEETTRTWVQTTNSKWRAKVFSKAWLFFSMFLLYIKGM